mmetsp:Transcript_6144/g.18338  ORF Transcript_6144/g.18338 Transcript_6144/m.18338 type:complete len:83 (+) Transcript_6144:1895-2143(+)
MRRWSRQRRRHPDVTDSRGWVDGSDQRTFTSCLKAARVGSHWIVDELCVTGGREHIVSMSFCVMIQSRVSLDVDATGLGQKV